MEYKDKMITLVLSDGATSETSTMPEGVIRVEGTGEFFPRPVLPLSPAPYLRAGMKNRTSANKGRWEVGGPAPRCAPDFPELVGWFWSGNSISAQKVSCHQINVGLVWACRKVRIPNQMHMSSWETRLCTREWLNFLHERTSKRRGVQSRMERVTREPGNCFRFEGVGWRPPDNLVRW